MVGRFGLVQKQNGSQIPLESINIRVDVQGFTAHVVASMKYTNKEENPIEAIYIFPLDEQAAVCGFQATIDGRTVVAEVQEKQEARDTYDDAISSGQSAFLLEESDESSDIFQINVGNLPPKTDALVEVRFVTELSVEAEGRVVFVLPTVLNPRYSPADSAASLSTQIPRAASVDSPYSFEFEMKVRALSAISEITSPSNVLRVEVDKTDESRAKVLLAKAHDFDNDVVVQILTQDPFKPLSIVEKGIKLKDREDKEGFMGNPVVMLNFFPEFKNPEASDEGEFVFVVDRSGSMSGSRNNSAKETLLLFLKSLPDGCYFNVVGFGSRYTTLFNKSQLYNDESLKAATALAQSMQADLGGTEILEPLKWVFSQPSLKGRPRQLFLLTDGEVGNTDKVINLVQKHSNTTRCFTFGIGSGVSTALIKGVARAGKGTAEFVVSQEDRLQTKVIKTLKRALQPVISDVSIAWDLAQGWTVEQIPSSLPPLFSGDRLVVYGFLKPSEKASQVGQNEVRLQGTLGKDKKMEHLIMFPTPSTAQGADSDSHSSDFLHCLAAKTFIQMKQGDLTDKYGAELEEAKSPIISISKTVNVVSKFTSFVAVDRDSLLPVSRPLRKQVIPLFGAYGCYSMGLPTPILPYAMSAPPGAAGFSDHSLPSLKLMSAQPPLPASTMVVGGGYPQRPPQVVPYKMACANTCSSVPPPRRGASHAFAFGGGHVQRRPQEVFGGGIPPTRPPLEESYEMKDCYMYPDSPPRASHWMATLGGGCPPSTSAFASQGRRGCILTLITLQRASGAWDLTDQLIALCSTNKDALITGCPTEIAVSTKEGKLLWATALALVLLMFKFLDQKDEWEMIADKGMKWLRRNLPGAVKYDNVLKSAATAAGVQM